MGNVVRDEEVRRNGDGREEIIVDVVLSRTRGDLLLCLYRRGYMRLLGVRHS